MRPSALFGSRGVSTFRASFLQFPHLEAQKDGSGDVVMKKE